MRLDRREFNLSALALLLSGCADQPQQSANDIILGGGRYQDLDTGDIHHVLSIVDLASGSRHTTATSFLPHGVHRKPTDYNCLAVFEKIGPGACEYDLRERAITRYIPTAEQRYFYGHGAYSLDGSLLYSTETNLDTYDGAIAVRDSDDMNYLGEFPTYGKEPHECKLIDNGKTLVVTNGGGALDGDAPSVTYIDIASQKLLEKVELTNARFNTGHLAISANGDLVVVSAPRSGLGSKQLGGVSIRPSGAAIESLGNPEQVTQRMQGEALSVAVHDGAGIAAVTHPDGDMLTFWSIVDRQLLNVVELPYPRGVALTADDKDFIVSYGQSADLLTIPVATLQPDNDSVVEQSYITGSHIYNWSRQMSEILSPGPFV